MNADLELHRCPSFVNLVAWGGLVGDADVGIIFDRLTLFQPQPWHDDTCRRHEAGDSVIPSVMLRPNLRSSKQLYCIKEYLAFTKKFKKNFLWFQSNESLDYQVRLGLARHVVTLLFQAENKLIYTIIDMFPHFSEKQLPYKEIICVTLEKMFLETFENWNFRQPRCQQCPQFSSTHFSVSPATLHISVQFFAYALWNLDSSVYFFPQKMIHSEVTATDDRRVGV